jgi:hypothetical protein
VGEEGRGEEGRGKEGRGKEGRRKGGRKEEGRVWDWTRGMREGQEVGEEGRGKEGRGKKGGGKEGEGEGRKGDEGGMKECGTGPIVVRGWWCGVVIVHACRHDWGVCALVAIVASCSLGHRVALRCGAIALLSCWAVVAIGRVRGRHGWRGPVGRSSPLMPFVGGVLRGQRLS